MSETLYVRHDEPPPMSDEESANDSDVWDDSLLIKAYNRAVEMAKEKIAKKNEANNTEEPTTTGQVERTHKTSPTKKSARNNERTARDLCEWKAGMPCRAVFSEDGREYEATVVYVDVPNDMCKICYVGYNNEEDVPISALKPSKGSKARNLQKKQSLSSNECVGNGHSDAFYQQVPQHTGEDDMGVIPPPPPPHVMAHFPKDESDALSAMLMSWYMSGYHTGFYQGLMRSKMSRVHGDFSQTTQKLN